MAELARPEGLVLELTPEQLAILARIQAVLESEPILPQLKFGKLIHFDGNAVLALRSLLLPNEATLAGIHERIIEAINAEDSESKRRMRIARQYLDMATSALDEARRIL